jgi:acetate---CoA ligase (ADP-forming)
MGREKAVDFFFEPKGIGLIGASANPLKGGHFILKNLMAGFQGNIYPVNPEHGEINGLKCYPSILEVPDPIDFAIIFVPAEPTLKVAAECAERGLPGVMVQSAGFAEVGGKGKALEKELQRIGRKSGMRIWGPNCMGLVDAVKRYVFSFVSPAIWDDGLVPGKVSFIVQSGMLSAGFLIDIMSHGAMGISKACSIGNKVDVDESDLLQYLINDPDTGTVGLYLESMNDGKRFLDLCRRSSKPIVVLQGGKSERGAQAALSHTASVAGDRSIIRGALAQAGVVEAGDFIQLMDLSRTLAAFPGTSFLGNGRIALLTYSGAAGIVSSDFLDQHGLLLADLSDGTKQKLKDVFPEWMPVSNPVDLWPAMERNGAMRVWDKAFRAVCADPSVDAVFFHLFVGGLAGTPDISPLAEIARKAGKPIFAWILGKRKEAHTFQLQCRDLGVPIFREIGRAVECMAAVFRKNA